ncbi:unnamed protein product, partial [Adineta steineri]
MSSLSSSSSSAPTPTSSSTLLMGAPTDYRRLPKCPRTASAIAQRIIEAAVVPSSEPATVPLPTQLDMIRIYNDKNVLFLGDSGARRRLTDCKGDFDGIFADFQLKFPNICTQIREAFPSTSTHDPVIIWLPPAPARLLTAIEDDQFQLLVNTCTKIIKQHKFELIETMEPWVEKRKDLYNETTHFLSPEGVRSLTIAITRQALKILGGPLIMYPIPILPQSLLLRTNP